MIDGIPNRPLYFYQKDIIGESCKYINLIGGLEHGFYFSIYWEYIYIIIPTASHSYFSEG